MNTAQPSFLTKILTRLRLPLAVASCRMRGQHKPLVVLMYLTDRCNLRCTYCVGHWSGRKLPDPSLEEIKDWVDQFTAMGTRHVTIHGGEILLRQDTASLIEYMKGKGLYVNLVSNGIILPENIDQLAGVDSLCISLDGRQEANDANRGKGSYEKIMLAIMAAKREGFPLTVQCTLTKNNIGEIEYLAEQAKRIGYYQQFSLLLKPNSESNMQLGLEGEDIRQALSSILDLKRKGFPIFTSEKTLINALAWPLPYDQAMLDKQEAARHPGIIPCQYGKLKVVIDANANVLPCSSLNDSFSAMNLRQTSFAQAYRHVLESNTCESCFFLTQNDWSLLLGLSPSIYLEQAAIQLKNLRGKF